jgi:DNA polymerase IIIc chi subunit
MSNVHMPDVARQREMLESALTQVRDQGFSAHINSVVAAAQSGEMIELPTTNGGLARVDKAKHLVDLADTFSNAKAAAEKLQAEIDALEPKP